MDTLEQIEDTDKNIALLREKWIEEQPDKKARWMTMINKLLDERIELMAERDKK